MSCSIWIRCVGFAALLQVTGQGGTLFTTGLEKELPVENLVGFGTFELDLRARELRKHGLRIRLPEQSIQVLAMLVERPGQVVLREEIQKKLWPNDTIVEFDHSINAAVKRLRRALGDDAETPRYVETLPRRGYRFIYPVDGEGAGVVPAQPGRPPGAPLRRWLVAVGLVVIAAGVGTYLYLARRQSQHLTEQDTVVLADFANQTGDPVFDDALKQALRVALHQSPFLNVLSDDQVTATLRWMARPAGTTVTGEVARDVCQRVGGRAYIAGSIAALGSEYVLGLKAVGCAGEQALAEEQATAAGRENVVNTLGAEATTLREKLGESLASVQKFDTPLGQATTSSLEALRAYTLGGKARREEGNVEAIPLFERAIELDPDFAMAHEQLGDCYYFHKEMIPAVENFKKAFELRARASEGERLRITLSYYYLGIGDLQKAVEVAKLYVATYPRSLTPILGLGAIYARLSQYEGAVTYTQQAIALSPNDPIAYGHLMEICIALNRLDQARDVYEQAKAQGLSRPDFHFPLYLLAFLQHDAPAMEREGASLDNKPGLDVEMLCRRASSEASYGRFRQALEFTRRAVESSAHGGSNETAAECLARRAFEEAVAGKGGAAQKDASGALDLASGRDGETLAAFAFAATDKVTRAQALGTDLASRFPLDTLVNSVYLPTLRAALAIRRGDAAMGLEFLEHAKPFETGLWALVPMYPVYVRGQAYLCTGQGDKAAEQFTQILDHQGLVGNCLVGALARLGLARAYALEASRGVTAVAAAKNHGSHTGETPVPQQAALAKARAAYQDFFTLWKDADPDIPILKQAKAEYAKLQ